MNPLRYGLCGILVLCLAASAAAQPRDNSLPRVSPNASVGFTLGVTDITITYSAPSVRGRTIFGELVPYGETWRAGANEATAITFSTDVTVEGEPLPAGTYGLFVVPEEHAWTFVFNRMPEQWGAYAYDEAQDALRVTVEPDDAPFRETMTFYFDDYEPEDGGHEVEVVLHWAETRAAFEVEAETDAILRQRAQAAAANASDWREPYRYAAYALDAGWDAAEALAWAEASVAAEERYENLALKARLHAAAGDEAAAAEAGARALELGRAMAEPPNGLADLEARVADWQQ